ncbi:hypothetical protein LUZ60_009707 [Juncus effusus]|nr:hypothetical protein LUZ60_009707 [Juncus effusus]
MRPKLILFGDSITEFAFAEGGWGSSLTNHFNRKMDIVLRGLCGYNTRWALLGIQKAVEGVGGATPAAVTVFLGANDAALVDQPCGYQHVPVEEYRENLREIYEFFKKQWPSIVVIFITPPPIDEEARIKDGPEPNNPSAKPERTNEAAGNYADACVSLAKELNTPFIDIYSKMQTVSNWQSLLSDGLHFSALGNKFMFDELVEKLKEVGLSDESLPFDLPFFLDIDPKNPSKSFGN